MSNEASLTADTAVRSADGLCFGPGGLRGTSVHDGATTLGYYIGYDRSANAAAPLYLTLCRTPSPSVRPG